ncbi:MAG: rRNA maturation RNase YbeY [Enterobacterales bacterium]|nr:rRNA maturation RNase YbeY [Enterobacterales bacterium]
MQIHLDIQNSIDADDIPTQTQIGEWIKTTLNQINYEANTACLTLRIVSSDEIQQLNSDFRGKESPTNVLSFPFEIPEMIPASEFEGVLGDLAICRDLVISEAQQQDKLIEHHWAHLIVHGVLHLLGYDHIEDHDAEAMESLEVVILAKHQIKDPYLS